MKTRNPNLDTETRDTKDFFRELKESSLYKDINPLDLDNEQSTLADITNEVEEFVLERFLETFPCADPITRESVKGLPYDKAYSMLTEYSEMSGKKRSVRKLMREIIAASERYLPKWYKGKPITVEGKTILSKGEGENYFEVSHINRLLETL